MPLTFTPLSAPCPGWFFSPHILPACFSFKTLISLPNYVPPVPLSSNSLKSPGSGLGGGVCCGKMSCLSLLFGHGVVLLRRVPWSGYRLRLTAAY